VRRQKSRPVLVQNVQVRTGVELKECSIQCYGLPHGHPRCFRGLNTARCFCYAIGSCLAIRFNMSGNQASRDIVCVDPKDRDGCRFQQIVPRAAGP
jgi:hypothetical protein